MLILVFIERQRVEIQLQNINTGNSGGYNHGITDTGHTHTTLLILHIPILLQHKTQEVGIVTRISNPLFTVMLIISSYFYNYK